MTARPGMAETRRRALIGAALREISDRGSLDVTVAQIASRAGVSSALAHHYFGAKDDLILATMRHLLAEFGAGVVASLRRADEPARPALGDHRAAASAPSSSTAPPSAPGSPSTPGRSRSPGAARLLRVYQRRLHSQPRPRAEAAGRRAEAPRESPTASAR